MQTMNSGERIHAFLVEQGLSAAEASSRSLAAAATGASEEALAEFFGHGPLSEPLADESVTEVLVNGPGEIWLERLGKLERWPLRFSSEESLRRYVRRLLSTQGRKIDQRSPFADAVIEEGIRVHVAGPPVASQGLCLSLRKPARVPWSLERWERLGSLDGNTANLLRSFVRERRNIFVSGGTGSGKTSLLGALLHEVPADERIVALEDVAEIRVSHPHFLSLEARVANEEGEGEISLQRLLKESLRMRPDRLVVGECRGRESLDLLMALNTGHRGSFGTIHANSPRDALQRLQTLALLAAENLCESVLKQLIVGSIQVIVQLERGAGGRRISSIAELRGVDGGNFLLREGKL